MPFTAGGSATSGLTAYSLERPAHTLYPEAAGYRRPGSLWAARFTRLLRSKRSTSAGAALQDTPVGKAVAMSTFENLAAGLKKAAADIVNTAVPEKREELLGKAIDSFMSEISGLADEAVQEAFSDGLGGDVAKFFGADRATMRKGLTHVSQFAMTLRSAETMVKGMAQDTWDNPPSAETIDGLDAWIGIGKGLLKRVTDEAVSGDDGEEVEKAFSLNGAELKKFADGLGEMIAAQQERLAKAEGDGVSDMDPLDVIARLATAILMQIDDLQSGGGDPAAADPAAQGGEAAAAAGGGGGGGGRVPPQFQKRAPAEPEMQKVAIEPEVVDAGTNLFRLSSDESGVEVGAVYDVVGEEPRELGKFADFASLEQLKGADIPAGHYGTCMAKGYFRAGGAPAGQLIAEAEILVLPEEAEQPLGKAADFGDMAAFQTMLGEAVAAAVAPLQKRVDDLAAENEKLRKSPQPAKVVKPGGTALAKTADDTVAGEKMPTAEELLAMDESSRAIALVKVAQGRPIHMA